MLRSLSNLGPALPAEPDATPAALTTGARPSAETARPESAAAAVYVHTPAVSLSALQGGTFEASLRHVLAARTLERKDERIQFKSVLLSHVEWLEQTPYSLISGDVNDLFVVHSSTEDDVRKATRQQPYLLKESLKPDLAEPESRSGKRLWNSLARKLHMSRSARPQLALVKPSQHFAATELAKAKMIAEKAGPHPNLLLPEGLVKARTADGREFVALLTRNMTRGNFHLCLLALQAQRDSLGITDAEFFACLRFVLAKVLSVISHMQRAGLVHNDMKCDNIVFDDNGEPYVIDFDITVAEGEMQNHGSLEVMSPQAKDPKSGASVLDDLYSIGKMIEEEIVKYREVVSLDTKQKKIREQFAALNSLKVALLKPIHAEREQAICRLAETPQNDATEDSGPVCWADLVARAPFFAFTGVDESTVRERLCGRYASR